MERGTDEKEIRTVLENGFPIPGKYNRQGKAKVFGFNAVRLGNYYEQKRVEVFYLIENNEVITVTVFFTVNGEE